MRSMKIYIAGPYTAQTMEEIEENVKRAIDVGIEIWMKGHFPLIPHLLHWVDLRARELEMPMGWTDYMLWDAPWLDHCDALFLLAESKGALIEYKRALEEGKVIYYAVDEIPLVERKPTWANRYVNDS